MQDERWPWLLIAAIVALFLLAVSDWSTVINVNSNEKDIDGVRDDMSALERQAAAGELGEPGPEGNEGSKGAKGSQGSPGAAGLPGMAGAIGPAGEDGQQGENGSPGSDGGRGRRGPRPDSAHPDAPRVDGRPEPDGEQQTQKENRVGPHRRRRQCHEVGRDHSAYEPAQCDTGDQERSPFESLAIVELTKSGKDTGQKERNDCSTSSGRVGH